MKSGFQKPAHWCQAHSDCVSATPDVAHVCPALTRETVSAGKTYTDSHGIVRDSKTHRTVSATFACGCQYIVVDVKCPIHGEPMTAEKPICKFCGLSKEARHACARPTDQSLSDDELAKLWFSHDESVWSTEGAWDREGRLLDEVDRLQARNHKLVETAKKWTQELTSERDELRAENFRLWELMGHASDLHEAHGFPETAAALRDALGGTGSCESRSSETDGVRRTPGVAEPCGITQIPDKTPAEDQKEPKGER